MVIVSIVPFAPGRILVWVAVFSALSVANCFANSLLFSAKRTPYDHQMARIQPVLSTPVPPRRGDLSLLLVIGRRAPTSRSTHTWVEWTSASVTFVLDPTINWVARAVNEIPENSYVPYYAYAGSRKYRAATATSLYAGL